MLLGSDLIEVEGWERVDDLYGFQADGDHTEEEFQGIFSVAHGLGGPEVGVVDDAAGFVGVDALASLRGSLLTDW